MNDIRIPCKTCPVLAICINKKLEDTIQECSILLNYVVSKRDSHGKVLKRERFYEVCSIMGIKIRKEGNFIIMERRDGTTNEVSM